MNSSKLLFKRLSAEWKYQYSVFKSIADWTIILYVAVPAAFISFFIYRSWWTEMPEWISMVPAVFLFLPGYIASWGGHYRTFIQEADKVFLIKNRKLYFGLKKGAFFYSLLAGASQAALIAILLLPFLMGHYGFTMAYAASYFLFFFSCRVFIMWLKQKLRKIEGKFLRILSNLGSFVLLSWVVQLIFALWIGGNLLLFNMSAILLLALGIFLYSRILPKTSTFDSEAAFEREERVKYTGLIFQLSYEVEMPSTSTVRKKPFLFRHSKRIFKNRTVSAGFLEVFIKVFLRSPSYWSNYLKIISPAVAAIIIIPPIWLKTLIAICFLIMMFSWLQMIWGKITISHPLTKKYGERDAYFSARSKAVWVLFLLSIILVILAAAGGLWLTGQMPAGSPSL
ncbi:ABC transporter permease [Bacillus infantis]|uniref:ABC transporter permease n=1 Tax=Bacillus infantis TaxID=324767 RepID=UPI003CEE99B1